MVGYVEEDDDEENGDENENEIDDDDDESTARGKADKLLPHGDTHHAVGIRIRRSSVKFPSARRSEAEVLFFFLPV